MNSINPKKNVSSSKVVQLFEQKDKSYGQSNTVQSISAFKSASNQLEVDTVMNEKPIFKSPPQRKQFWMSDTPVEVWE